MSGGTDTPRVPATPDVAGAVFGAQLTLAERYVAMLADTGIAHGLIGPREAPRLWDRHVLNCAVVHEAFDQGASVVDLGSGAGLPGLVLAIARPDLRLRLVDPLLRRTEWLSRTVADLALDNVSVYRGRAESLWGRERYDYATARAVARIGELGRMALPLLEAGGTLHALKGEQASSELATDETMLRELGATSVSLRRYGLGVVDPETVLLSVTVTAAVGGTTNTPTATTRSAKARRRR